MTDMTQARIYIGWMAAMLLEAAVAFGVPPMQEAPQVGDPYLDVTLFTVDRTGN